MANEKTAAGRLLDTALDGAKLKAAHDTAGQINAGARATRERRDVIRDGIMRYEIAYIAGDASDAVCRDVCGGCFDLMSSLPLPAKPVLKVYGVFGMLAYAMLGGRMDAMRRVMRTRAVWNVPQSTPWNERALYDTYRAALHLVLDTDADLAKASRVVERLRGDQNAGEGALFRDVGDEYRQGTALYLWALYNTAAAIDELARFRRGTGDPAKSNVGVFMDTAAKGAMCIRDYAFGPCISLLRDAFKVWPTTPRAAGHLGIGVTQKRPAAPMMP